MNRRSVRLSSGELKGASSPVESGVRPTSARVREALLDAWQARLEGARLLDLFAGTGAVGVEALGRGAALLVGVEARSRVFATLRRTYERLGEGRTQALRAELPQGLDHLDESGTFDLMFADPPYAFDRFAELLTGCAPLLSAGGELALEHSSRLEVPSEAAGLRLLRSRRYGESTLSYYGREEDRDG